MQENHHLGVWQTSFSDLRPKLTWHRHRWNDAIQPHFPKEIQCSLLAKEHTQLIWPRPRLIRHTTVVKTSRFCDPFWHGPEIFNIKFLVQYHPDFGYYGHMSSLDKFVIVCETIVFNATSAILLYPKLTNVHALATMSLVFVQLSDENMFPCQQVWL